MTDKEIEEHFEAKNRLLDLMDRILETQLKIYEPIKDTFFDRILNWFKKISKNF